ncbi:MAG: family 78 glycoside hydrolase catalytic domain [Eubacteriales bacterium]|nr:family 78 glycoside hydrolase catalytic domain [Eubacteriales bacterium]
MRITRMQVNHLSNPLGYALAAPKVSFRVTETEGKKPQAMQVRVASDPDFSDILFDTGKDASLSLLGVPLQMELRPRTRYYWKASVWADNGDFCESDTAWFETAKMEEPWEARWITCKALGDQAPVFSKEFTVDEAVSDARIYAVGLGVYELFLDGEKIGDEYLAPGSNDYNRWIQYQTYAVSLSAGKHILQAYVADGWYKGRFGLDYAPNCYGDTYKLLLEMVLPASDGSITRIVTDESWKAAASDLTSDSIYNGEVYTPSEEAPVQHPVDLLDEGTELLTARYSLPVVVKETRKPTLIVTPAGERVLDAGQNMAGFMQFHSRLPKGTRVRLLYGEHLEDGNFYNGNLSNAKAEYVYVSDGAERDVRVHFTYYGFRYVKLEGFPEEIDVNDFTACTLYSDLETTGSISTDNPLVNQLISNAFWGQKSNYVDVPTDCPQRSERLGWTADTQVFSGTACFNMDSYSFLRKFAHDLYETQLELGHVPNVVPAFHEDGPTGSVWGDAATIVPWNLYRYYGDLSILEEQFDSMAKWVDSIKAIDEATGGRRKWDVGFHFGDWLALDGEGDDTFKGSTEDGYVATAYYYNSARIVAKAAALLGRTEEAASYGKLADEIKAVLQAEYFTPNGRLAITTQTGYALALYMDFAPENSKPVLAQFLLDKLKVNKGYLKTGFVGTPILCQTLSDYGNNEMAYKLLLNEDSPSWLYEVKMGATTIWERWNSILPDGHINPTNMNSLNHYSLGSIVEWMYRNMAGLHLKDSAPGFTDVDIIPQPDYRIRKCDMGYESAAGRYEIHWTVEASGDFDLTVTIPFGAAATLTLPNKADDSVIRLEAGTYHFRYTPDTPIIKVYGSSSSMNDILENAAAKAVLESYVPAWAATPVPMRDMNMIQLSNTPFVPLSEEQLAAMDAELKKC